ncbi:MAG: hypothetical protein AB3N14_09535 [Flavobacteriaceae bacterium]
MKTVQITLLTLLSFLTLSCQDTDKKLQTNSASIGNDPLPTLSNTLKKHHYKDSRSGLVVYSKEFPSEWKVVSMPSYKYDKAIPSFSYQIQGPGGVKAFNSMHEIYTYNENPQYNQMMGAYGIKVKEIPNINSLMEVEFAPKMRSLGFSYLGTEMATDMEQIFRQKMKKQGLPQMDFKILSTKWTNGKGAQALVNLVFIKFDSSMPYMGRNTTWTYGVDYLIADTSELHTAYEAIKKSLLSEVENPQWLQYKNKIMMQRQQQSNMDHQRRMAANQAQFESHQQYMKGVYASSDANHNAYMQRLRGTDGSDAGHQSYINMIRDEETVFDANGQSYTVDGYAQQYWTDSDGNYIKTDDLFYNPNGDINLNHKDWTSLQRRN